MPPLDAQPDWPIALVTAEAAAAGCPSAMDRALALATAAGRADGAADRMTAPFEPALRNLRYRLLLWASCTRDEQLREWLPEYRHRARAAVQAHRALREGRN